MVDVIGMGSSDVVNSRCREICLDTAALIRSELRLKAVEDRSC